MHIWGHFKTITHHRHLVIKHCFKCGLYWRGLMHDLSKYSPVEFWPGAKYYLGNRSPNEKERELKGYSAAWLHHKGRNRHHWEYWNDYNPATCKVEPVIMPTEFIIEMFCDRVAASKVYKGKDYDPNAALEYFKNRKDYYGMHKVTADKLEFLLTMLAEKGEKETFAYIKKNRKTL